MEPVSRGRTSAAALNLWAQAQERTALGALAAAGLDVVVVAGPSVRHAGEDGMSPSCVEVLVRRADLPGACLALVDSGFRLDRRGANNAILKLGGFRAILRPLRERAEGGSTCGSRATIGAAVRRTSASWAADRLEHGVPAELAASARELCILLSHGMTVKELAGVRRRSRQIEGVTLSVPEGVCAPTTWARPLVDAWTQAGRAATGSRRPVYLDVGTGTGVLSILAALEHPGRFIALDRSPRALRTARRNARRAGARGIRFAYGDLVGPLPDAARGAIHAVVENLPSVAPHEFAADSWRDPEVTVEGVGVDGLGLVRRLAAEIRPYLAPGARLVLPVKRFQWEILEPELDALGYVHATASVPFGPTSVMAVVQWTS